MGWNDHLDDSELANLPPEAWGNTFDIEGPFDPEDTWLENADVDDQRTAMREWFLARYCDPAFATPYDGREGGYQYIHGGPFNPSDVLHQRFGKLVDGELIEDLVDEFVADVGTEWAPIVNDMPDDYQYDEHLELQLGAAAEPLGKVEARVQELLAIVVAVPVGGSLSAPLVRLVYGALIGVVEAFLWQTAEFWIEKRPEVLRRCIEKLQVFRDRPMKLGDIFLEQEKLNETVKGYLQHLVWHRWDQVVPLYKLGLGITLPRVKPFSDALDNRHHIVHRSGTDLAGNEIKITKEDVEALAAHVREFARQVSQACAEKFEPSPSDGVDADDF